MRHRQRKSGEEIRESGGGGGRGTGRDGRGGTGGTGREGREGRHGTEEGRRGMIARFFPAALRHDRFVV